MWSCSMVGRTAASEVVSLAEQFSESSYKIIKPVFKQESKEKWSFGPRGPSAVQEDRRSWDGASLC